MSMLPKWCSKGFHKDVLDHRQTFRLLQTVEELQGAQFLDNIGNYTWLLVLVLVVKGCLCCRE